MSKVKRLGDIVNFKRGYDLPAHQRKQGCYPVVSSSGISGYHSEYKADGEGIVTGRYGTLGEMHYVNGRYWPHNTALYVTDFKGNYPKYVYYLLKCLGNLKTSDKGAVPGINRNDLHELFVPYVAEGQKVIAAILSSIDQKIEINNRINAKLEAMAKTLYDYWFVQFDFPDENCKPYKSSGGKMVYSKELKREIPADWEVSNILQVADLFGGGTPSKNDLSFWNGEIPFFTPTDTSQGVFQLDTEEHITEDGLKSCSSVLFDKGTVFITARGSVGKFALTARKMAMNQSCYALQPKVGCGSEFIYFLTQELIHHLKIKSSGSVFKSIVSNDIKFTQMCIPDNQAIQAYSKVIEPLFEKILTCSKENQQLTALRDWLLPMLMNGQVQVTDTQSH